MKRVTVTLPDELETELVAFLTEQETPFSVTTVMQTALREGTVRCQRRRGGVGARG